MVNRRLHGAMLNAEMTPARLAELAEVDVKAVQRWLVENRRPYPITRHKVARALGHEETYLWPELLTNGFGAAPDAVGGVWPTRTAISSEMWHSLFDHAKRKIDILIYAGAFLVETLDLLEVLRFKSARGTVIRLLVGDPDSAAVKARSEELGLAWLAERCRTTATYLEQDIGSNVCVRAHGTTLYASTFRFDDTLLINTHAYGMWASQSPVLRVDCPGDPFFQFYADAFQRVWLTSSEAVQPRCHRSGPGG